MPGVLGVKLGLPRLCALSPPKLRAGNLDVVWWLKPLGPVKRACNLRGAKAARTTTNTSIKVHEKAELAPKAKTE